MESRESPWPRWAWPALVGLFQIVGSFGAADNQPERYSIDALAVVLILVGPAALAAGRRYEPVGLVATMAATVLYLAVGYPYGPIFVSLVLMLFRTVTGGRRTTAWIVAGFGFVGFMAGRVPIDGQDVSWAQATGVAAWLLVVLVVAEVARARGDRAAEARRAREEEVRRRASEERMRIARELHDVLAHNISMINVQAGVALHLMDERPEHARTALAAIKDASKEALGELRSVLGVLRQVDETEPRDPAPGLSRLDTLVSRAEAAGLTVRMAVRGEARPLPAGLDLAAYRIVQEALTNVARHAAASRAEITVAYGPKHLTVEVCDDGRGQSSPATTGTGSGIAGMAERASALGGLLDAGPLLGGGFRVRARLPLERPS